MVGSLLPATDAINRAVLTATHTDVHPVILHVTNSSKNTYCFPNINAWLAITSGIWHSWYLSRYKVCLFATDGTAEAEFIFFGEMGRLLIRRDINSLMRTNPRPGDIPSAVAAVVSHKYQLTINVTQRALQRAEYSYQVRSIYRSYGPQTVIPEIRPPATISQLIASVPTMDKGERKIGETSEPPQYSSWHYAIYYRRAENSWTNCWH